MIMFNCVTFSRRLHADDITRSFNYIIFRQLSRANLFDIPQIKWVKENNRQLSCGS